MTRHKKTDEEKRYDEHVRKMKGGFIIRESKWQDDGSKHVTMFDKSKNSPARESWDEIHHGGGIIETTNHHSVDDKGNKTNH